MPNIDIFKRRNMLNQRVTGAVCAVFCLLSLSIGVLPARTLPAPTSESEKAIWDLERSYWHYVEANDLSAYRNLWHADFLGWPSVSATPLHKDHITDWITSQTSTGLTFKLIHFKPAAIQMSGETAVACYWTTYKWADKAGAGAERTVRVTHTWIKNGKDWQIIGGMSMPETALAQK
jgi:ketosteroid isomerase-like protein